MKKGFLGSVVLGILIFGGIILWIVCMKRVPAGYAGVLYNMNGGKIGRASCRERV